MHHTAKDETVEITREKHEQLTDEYLVEGAKITVPHISDKEGHITDATTDDPKAVFAGEKVELVVTESSELRPHDYEYEYNYPNRHGSTLIHVVVEETAEVAVPEAADFDASDDPTDIHGVGPATAGGCENVGELVYYSGYDEIPQQAPSEIKNIVIDKEKWVDATQEVVIADEYQDDELEEQVEERAAVIEEHSVFSTEQARLVACKDMGLSHRETAELLDKPLGTVKSSWSKCKDKYRKAMWTSANLDEPFV